MCLPSDALLQHLPSYLGFSYLGRGVSLHGCSSKAQPLLLTLDKGYLLSIDGWGCVPYLLFYLRPNYGGGNEDNGDLLQKVPCTHCCTQCPQPCSRPPLTHASAGDSWTLMGKSGSVSCGVTAPFSWVLVYTRFCLCLPRIYFPVLCKFWQVYGGVNGNPLQEDLCHTQVCCTQSPCACGTALLTHTSTGDAQTQFCLSLCSDPNRD